MSEEQGLELSFDLEGSKSSTGFSGRKFDRLRVEKDSTVFVRIMPPFGTNHNRMLFRKYGIHWGFTTEDGGKRPVSCSYPTERFCPVCEKVKEFEAELASYKDKKTNKYVGGSKERVAELTDYIKSFGVNNFFALNAITNDGRAVILELKKTAVDNLMSRIDEAVKLKKFDPVSLDKGVWFAITRTGEGLKTKYDVDFKKITKKTADGEDAEVRDHTPIEAGLLAEVKAQLAEPGATGPLYDIHTLHEPCTSKQLKGYMEGEPLPGRSRKAEEPEGEQGAEEPGDAPQVDYATGAPDAEESKAAKPATPAAASKQAPKPAAPAAAAKPAIPNAKAEIERIRAMAAMKSGAQKPNASA